MNELNDETRELESQLYNGIVRRDWELVKDLLDHAAASSQKLPVVRRTAGNTLLHDATEQENVPPGVIGELLQVLEPTWKESNKWGISPLHSAVLYKQNLEIVSLLLKADGSAIGMTDRSGRTPMDDFFERLLPDEDTLEPTAFTENLAEMLRVLTKAWVDHDSSTSHSREGPKTTPLHGAIQVCFSNPDMPTGALHVMLEDDPFMAQTVDGNGCTPLHLASRHDDDLAVERVNLLLAKSPARVLQKRDGYGRTPLSNAVFWFAALEVIETLVVASPSCVCIPDHDGKTPLHLISDMIQGGVDASEYALEVARILVLKGNNNERPHILVKAMQMETCPVDLVRVLVRSSPQDASKKDHVGDIPLHTLASMPIKPYDSKAYTALLQELILAHPRGPRIPNHAGVLPLGLLVGSGRLWSQGVRTVLEAHPAAIVDEGLSPYALTTLLSKLTPSVLFHLLREAPFLVKRQEATL